MSRVLALLLLVAACGGGPSTVAADAPTPDDAALDAPVTACEGLGPGVHVEGDSVANDTTPEVVSAAVGGAGAARICGRFARSPSGRELDLYQFSLAAPARVRVEVDAPGAANVEHLVATVFATPQMPGQDMRRGTGRSAAGRVVVVAPNCAVSCAAQTLPAGDYVLGLSTSNPQVAFEPFDYRVTIAAFDAEATCVTPQAIAYQEMRDADPTNDQNDVVSGAGSLAEPSGAALTIAPAAYRATGTTGMHGVVDFSLDHDTYVLTTGPATTALDVRVAWPGATTDTMYLMLFEGQVGAATLHTTTGGGTNPQYQAAAVKPSTTYLLTVGAIGATSQVHPYDVTICGSSLP